MSGISFDSLKSYFASRGIKNIKVADADKKSGVSDDASLAEVVKDSKFGVSIEGDTVTISDVAKDTKFKQVDLNDNLNKDEREALGMTDKNGLYEAYSRGMKLKGEADAQTGTDADLLEQNELDKLTADVHEFGELFGYDDKTSWEKYTTAPLGRQDRAAIKETAKEYGNQYNAFKPAGDKTYNGFLVEKKGLKAENPILKDLPAKADGTTGTQYVLRTAYEKGQTDFSATALDKYLTASNPVKEAAKPAEPPVVASTEPKPRATKLTSVQASELGVIEKNGEDWKLKEGYDWFDSASDNFAVKPDEGYVWANPGDQNDYKVKKEDVKLAAPPSEPTAEPARTTEPKKLLIEPKPKNGYNWSGTAGLIRDQLPDGKVLVVKYADGKEYRISKNGSDLFIVKGDGKVGDSLPLTLNALIRTILGDDKGPKISKNVSNNRLQLLRVASGTKAKKASAVTATISIKAGLSVKLTMEAVDVAGDPELTPPPPAERPAPPPPPSERHDRAIVPSPS